jgi:hypothetical protein
VTPFFLTKSLVGAHRAERRLVRLTDMANLRERASCNRWQINVNVNVNVQAAWSGVLGNSFPIAHTRKRASEQLRTRLCNDAGSSRGRSFRSVSHIEGAGVDAMLGQLRISVERHL